MNVWLHRLWMLSFYGGKSRSNIIFCSSITTAGAKTISIWLVLWLEGTNPPGGETHNPQLRQDYRIIPSMSQNCLKFWDKFETKLRTDLRPYRDNLETYLTILLLRANWDIFETWVHSENHDSFWINYVLYADCLLVMPSKII